MKMRYEIKFKTTPNDKYKIITLLMKDIQFVIIDGIKYKKPSVDKNIQTYYYLIQSNGNDITELMVNGIRRQHIFLKNASLHSYNTYCMYDYTTKSSRYALDGILLDEDEALAFLRSKKIKKIKEIISKK